MEFDREEESKQGSAAVDGVNAVSQSQQALSVRFNPNIDNAEESKNPLLTENETHRLRNSVRSEKPILAANLQQEIQKFKDALREIIAKASLGEERDDTDDEERQALMSHLVETTLREVEDDKLARNWKAMQQMSKNEEVFQLFTKMADNKEDFAEMLKNVDNHQEMMQKLTQCYEDGDLARLQLLLKEIIENDNKHGFAKKTAFLLEVGQQAMTERGANGDGVDGQSFGQPTQRGALGGINIFGLIMPSLNEFKQLASSYGAKKKLLREIKSAIIEKLTNKILRAFVLEIAFVTPFLLLVGLQYRQAALTDPIAQCYGDMARWLLSVFLASVFFSFLRLVRVPVLRGLTHNFYFSYVMIVSFVQVCFYAGWFFYGNAVFFKSLNRTDCDAIYADAALTAQQHFNPIYFHIIMGALLLVGWFILIALIQLLLFTLMLWSLWDGVVHATQRMQRGFSFSSMIELFMQAAGEGELQDSVMIGGLQYLMNDDSYFCKRCKQPFSHMQMQVNEFEDNLDKSHTITTQRGVGGEEGEIVQLGCNPAHVFHAECLEGFAYCPECFVPIDQDIRDSYLEGDSENQSIANGEDDSRFEEQNLDQQSQDGEERMQ